MCRVFNLANPISYPFEEWKTCKVGLVNLETCLFQCSVIGAAGATRRFTHSRAVAQRLIRRVKSPKRMLGDKAYDSAELREELNARGTKPVIPYRCNRKQPFSFSKRLLYKLRWRIESAFNRLKDFRRIATGYDRLARNYLASVCLVAALVCWV